MITRSVKTRQRNHGVVKHSGDRHFKSKIHEIALSLEKEKPAEERLDIDSGSRQQATSSISRIQPTIISCVETSSHDAGCKFLCTAYELAMSQSLPPCHFSILVKCQHENIVRLL